MEFSSKPETKKNSWDRSSTTVATLEGVLLWEGRVGLFGFDMVQTIF